ncbi:MAG: hypothetical protein IKN48_11325 [Bacteroidaceae bacterium]|nr:hypothetical protein [Bacteroidaceae bacterium]
MRTKKEERKIEWELHRVARKEDCTLGHLYCGGVKVCDTLEPHCIDWQKEKKVYGQTAIPEGVYRCIIGYSTRFKAQRPYLENVPHFSGIMIHEGRDVRSTKGCILVGTLLPHDRLTYSKTALEKVMEKLRYAEKTAQEVWITVY